MKDNNIATEAKGSDTLQLIETIASRFSTFKKEIDKYPNAFSLSYDKELGYLIEVDYDLLKHHQAIPTP